MLRIWAERPATIPAPAARAYETMADYRNGHPHILPTGFFANLEVEAGGRGAGTIIRFEMLSFGKRYKVRAAITEPEPGRVLAQADTESGAVTRFVVEPTGSTECRVTITTAYDRNGLQGVIEGLLVPRRLQRMYDEELRLLARHVAVVSPGSDAARSPK